jgi:hypothetical protein
MGDRLKETINGIDDAINNHVKTHKEGGNIVTGWIVIASVSESDHPERDGYVVQSSEGMPHHAHVGLLSMALDDKRNHGIIATLGSWMSDEDE